MFCCVEKDYFELNNNKSLFGTATNTGQYDSWYQ